MYTLLNNESKLIDFEVTHTEYEDEYEILKIYKENEYMLPVIFRKCGVTDYTLETWLKARVAPTGRHYIKAVLGAINLNNPFDVLMYRELLKDNCKFYLNYGNKQ